MLELNHAGSVNVLFKQSKFCYRDAIRNNYILCRNGWNPNRGD